MTTHPNASPRTPIANAFCPDHGHVAGRFNEGEFPYCTECGRTDLLDGRSVFECFLDAVALLDEVDPAVAPLVRMIRWDRVEAVGQLMADAEADHCSNCRRFAPAARAAARRLGFGNV